MTFDEYKAKMADVISDPATAADKAAALLNDIDADLKAGDKARDDVAALTGDMSRLQGKYNQLVIMGGRSGNPAGTAAEDSAPATWGDTVKSMAEELAGKEYVYGSSQ